MFIFLFNFSGERTFGVLTKIDLMDKGTDAVEVSQSIFNSNWTTCNGMMIIHRKIFKTMDKAI